METPLTMPVSQCIQSHSQLFYAIIHDLPKGEQFPSRVSLGHLCVINYFIFKNFKYILLFPFSTIRNKRSYDRNAPLINSWENGYFKQKSILVNLRKLVFINPSSC